MKKLSFIIILLLLFGAVLGTFTACQTEGDKGIDYVAQVTLDLNSITKKTEATVKTFIDGDTTHFNVPTSVSSTGVLKARYIAINTPESTGTIEEYGKAAANFTRSKLENAVSIYIESDDDQWNIDSTGSRHVVWVWYKSSQDAEYRNLNLEILQEGLAIPSNMADNRYGDYAVQANTQAQKLGRKVYSGKPDPDFYYGDARVTTIKALRLNPSEWVGTKVAVEGVVVIHNNNGMYIQEYDEETGVNFGFYCYYGYNLDSYELGLLATGNRIQLVGTVQYYEAGDSYQISGLKFDQLASKDDTNVTRLISKNNEIKYTLTAVADFNSNQINVTVNDELVAKDLRAVTLNTAISFENLYVYDSYTTTNSASASKGAMTLYCRDANGNNITLRTVVLYERNEFGDWQVITADKYVGKTINAKGIVDYYKAGSDYDDDGSDGYQIKIIDASAIVVVE